MADDTLRTLVCLVSGESSPFKVNPTISMNIMDLKGLIKEQGINRVFSSVDAKDLTLWKVDLAPPPIDEWKNLTGKNVPGSVKLEGEADNISLHWPVTMSPNPKRLHIIAELPSVRDQRKRRRLDDSWTPAPETEKDKRIEDLPRQLANTSTHRHSWLGGLHAEIWNRKELKRQLFRKVKVTQTDYTALQGRLNELHPDRDSPNYRGTKPDVLSAKLNFLRSLPQLDDNDSDDEDERLSNRDEDEEASNEDDAEIKSLFPFTIRFLDLSSLQLKEVPPRLPLPLFLRQDYKDISKLIKKNYEHGAVSVLVTGQPGTGKTAYLYLAIIESMIEARPFLFQTVGGIVYHVDGGGVNEIQWWSSEEPIMAFVDGNKADYAPKDFLWNYWVQLIVASPPTGAFSKWTKQVGHIDEFVVNLWSHKELLLTGIFLHRFDLPFTLLRKSTSYFGYNPRRCFEASTSVARLEDIMTDVASAIRCAAVNWNDIVQLLHKSRMGGSDVSHMIFQISPTNSRPFLLGCQVDTVSRWALDLLLQYSGARRADVTADFYYEITLLMPEAASLRGHLFKRQVLDHLCGIRTESTFSIRGLTNSEKTTWTYRGPIRRIDLENSTVSYELTEAVRRQESLHLVPLVRSFPAVDSILYDPKDQEAAFTCIQIPRNKDHAIDVPSLLRIQSWLKLHTPLEGLRPTEEDKPWRLLFVVPLSTKAEFKLQKLDPPSGVWAVKDPRLCVLGLEERSIFGRRSEFTSQQ